MRASLLMRDPEIQSVSMALLVGIASSIERESLKRYATLADTMERRGEAATAAAFRVMLEEERHHVDEVARWAAGLGEQVPEPGRFDWQLPAELSSSWDEIAGSALLTPYRAFAIAVDNEKRAFALYSYLAARATDPRVRAQAERLGIEELRHAAVMRRWRREAWHRERRAAREAPQPAASAVASADALNALLAKREAAIAQAHRTIAARLREIGDDESANLLETLLEAPSRPAAGAAGPPAPVPDTDDPVHLLVAAQKPLEALSEELEAVMGAATGALFEQSEAALVNVVTRLARIALRTAHALQAH
ncbi:MAG TPA: ferritin family protein [Burkholderiaceae bacterium]|nr:ferritin family protein [Burkholderiaceae bacterium]